MRLSRRASLLALAAAGCANPLSRPFPDKRIFVLDVTRPPPRQPAPRARSLLLREVAAAPGAEARGLVTRLSESRQQTDFWNEFALPPARLIDDRLRAWLADSGAVATVLDAGSRASAALTMEATLLALFADLTDPARPMATAGMSMLLLDASRSPPRLLSQARFAERTPLPSVTPAAIVAGLSGAVAAIFAGIERELRAAAA